MLLPPIACKFIQSNFVSKAKKMNDENFILAVKRHVRDAAVKGVMSNMTEPPGRNPKRELVRLSEWYCRQNDISKHHIAQVASDAANAALFGLFSALDGVRLIDEELREGVLRLVFEHEGRKTVLSDNQAISDLHTLYNATE